MNKTTLFLQKDALASLAIFCVPEGAHRCFLKMHVLDPSFVPDWPQCSGICILQCDISSVPSEQSHDDGKTGYDCIVIVVSTNFIVVSNYEIGQPCMRCNDAIVFVPVYMK